MKTWGKGERGGLFFRFLGFLGFMAVEGVEVYCADEAGESEQDAREENHNGPRAERIEELAGDVEKGENEGEKR